MERHCPLWNSIDGHEIPLPTFTAWIKEPCYIEASYLHCVISDLVYVLKPFVAKYQQLY